MCINFFYLWTLDPNNNKNTCPWHHKIPYETSELFAALKIITLVIIFDIFQITIIHLHHNIHQCPIQVPLQDMCQ